MGGMYNTSNPIEATYGNSFSTSAKVPCLPSSEEAERGNISYQVENRARSRSTSTSSGESQRSTISGSGYRSSSSRSDSVRAIAKRDSMSRRESMMAAAH